MDPGGDAGLRLLGMGIGGGAGAVLLVILSPALGIELAWVVGLPGIALAVGSGAFSLRRDYVWGVVTAMAGVAWTVTWLWLCVPSLGGLRELGLRLWLTPFGAVNLTIVSAVGVLVGAGWKKAPLPEVDPEELRD